VEGGGGLDPRTLQPGKRCKALASIGAWRRAAEHVKSGARRPAGRGRPQLTSSRKQAVLARSACGTSWRRSSSLSLILLRRRCSALAGGLQGGGGGGLSATGWEAGRAGPLQPGAQHRNLGMCVLRIIRRLCRELKPRNVPPARSLATQDGCLRAGSFQLPGQNDGPRRDAAAHGAIAATTRVEPEGAPPAA
jgi:hypothetical protein